jgi:hypothetical protein
MQPQMRTMTLLSYGEKPEDNLRVTLSVMGIKATLSKDVTVQGRAAKEMTVLFFDDSAPIILMLNELDSLQLESVVGCYGIFQE